MPANDHTWPRTLLFVVLKPFCTCLLVTIRRTGCSGPGRDAAVNGQSTVGSLAGVLALLIMLFGAKRTPELPQG